ncbi:hypothetical protein WN55_03828 [Dufourea novaeangliae]|uniref:Uncharacterized protein n=1 Tax=Dufourea novaeangliae TaxID=178035 RepID=A0A154NWS2_DUFNO|nr:hypothetical protein WN55_03828 [Dufourea novaeangliae]
MSPSLQTPLNSQHQRNNSRNPTKSYTISLPGNRSATKHKFIEIPNKGPPAFPSKHEQIEGFADLG